MKNLKSCLLGIGFCTALFMAACQQETIEQAEPAGSDEILANAGKIHNEMITYYYNNRKGEALMPADRVAEMLDLSWDYLQINGFESNYTMDTRRAIEERIADSCLKGASGKGFSTDTASFISQLTETGLYSRHFLNEIKKILSLAHAKDDRQRIRNYVNSTFLNHEFNSEADITGQHLYVTIFNASYDFWDAREESSLKGIGLKRSSWVIINDGIGGLLGMVFGPVGVIVTATVFSVGTNEEIND